MIAKKWLQHEDLKSIAEDVIAKHNQELLPTDDNTLYADDAAAPAEDM